MEKKIKIIRVIGASAIVAFMVIFCGLLFSPQSPNEMQLWLWVCVGLAVLSPCLFYWAERIEKKSWKNRYENLKNEGN